MREDTYSYIEDDILNGVKRKINALKRKNILYESQGIMLLGQPAAGKSVVTAEFEASYYNVDADDYRAFHPKRKLIEEIEGKDAAQYTGKFAGEVCENLIDQLAAKNANVIIQGTGRNFTTPYKTAYNLKEKGYNIDVYIVACPVKVSTASIFKRYYEMFANGEIGRFSNIEHTKVVLENLPENIDKLYQTGLFNHMYIVNRDGEYLWDNLAGEKPSEVLIREFTRPLTAKEQEWIHSTKAVIRKNVIEADKEIEIQNMEKAIHNIHSHVKDRYQLKTKA